MYRVKQDGLIVATCDSPKDAVHYATVYAEDGPVTVQMKKAGKWVNLFSINEGISDEQ